MLKRGQQRKLELSGFVLLAASALGLLLWAALWPIALPSPNFTPSTQPPAINQTLGTSGGDRSDAKLWDESLQARRLQGWVVDSTATTANSPLSPSQSPPPVKGPLSGVQLTGTFIEPGRSFALVADRHGSLDLKPVGGTLQLEPPGIRIDAITARSIEVSYQGKTQVLGISPPPLDDFSASTSTSQTVAANETPYEMTAMETGEMNAHDQPSDPATQSASPLEDELDWLNGSPSDETTNGADMRGDN